MPIEVTAYTPTVAPGPYQAVCTDVREKAAKSDPTNIFRIWEFTLADGRTVGATSSLSTSPKSKGGKWLAALLGRIPEVGASVEPIGRPCTIIVELDDNGYERVTTVAPPDGSMAKPRAVPPTEAAYAGTDEPEPSPNDPLPF